MLSYTTSRRQSQVRGPRLQAAVAATVHVLHLRVQTLVSYYEKNAIASGRVSRLKGVLVANVSAKAEIVLPTKVMRV
jgi:hypothetical protein